jgi:hypothetical protein
MPSNPFENMRPSPANHFRLYFYAAVSNLIDQVARTFGSLDAALELFPFLAGYNDGLAKYHLAAGSANGAGVVWANALRNWEATARCHLPLRALAQAANLDFATITALMTIGLVEEDSRFGFVFEHVHGIPGQPRPTTGLLHLWFGELLLTDQGNSQIAAMRELGVVRSASPDAPRSSQALQVPSLLWNAIRGNNFGRDIPWVQHRPHQALAEIDDLNLPEEISRQARALPSLFAAGDAQAFIVRGPQHNGRRTVAGSIARMLGRDVLEIDGFSKVDDERWRTVGPLATLLHAMPLLVFDLAPGDAAQVPVLEGLDAPLCIVLTRQGGVSGEAVERALTLTLAMPDQDARRQHWMSSLGIDDGTELETICWRFRMTSGNLRRTAALAKAYAALDERKTVLTADVQKASRALNRQSLDALAKHVTASGDWSQLAVAAHTFEELQNLETRCRHRERLQTCTTSSAARDINAGVRALFHGPSGTGKTLAAQLLAASLQMDLYRLDLSMVVNKYIGETEKNLDRIFARAEELDVILLLDEGDALLTHRTSVQTSNDRYANLETNYLLQRLESYEGILIVTTNALDCIDAAFQRRMDVMVDFRPPEAAERWNIWQIHLPFAHQVEAPLLAELASRCVLTGGQIRNAALHASVLALDRGEPVNSLHVELAVQREYRKTGGVCPLRRTAAAHAVRQ